MVTFFDLAKPYVYQRKGHGVVTPRDFLCDLPFSLQKALKVTQISITER